MVLYEWILKQFISWKKIIIFLFFNIICILSWLNYLLSLIFIFKFYQVVSLVINLYQAHKCK